MRLRPEPSNLESRVESRKRELISEIIDHKMNCSRTGAADAVEKAKARLSELAHIGVIDWANLGPKAKLELDEWMAK